MMILTDVYNTALQGCTNATTLIASSNEFFNNQLSSNGTVYSDLVHSCVIDGAYLSLFTSFEQFLEDSFICYMLGQPGLNGNSFVKYVSPQSEDQARSILKGTGRFADFTNRDTILKLASNFFDNGGTYSYLNSISADFEDMKKIRNAISHISPESERAFLSLVRVKIGSIPQNITTAMFLNMIMPNTTDTVFSYYERIVRCAITTIANP